MSKLRIAMVAIVTALAVTSFAPASVIQVDFSDNGTDGGSSGPATPDSTWNVLGTPGSYTGLADTDSNVTGVDITLDATHALGVDEKAVDLTGYGFDGTAWDPVANDAWQLRRDDGPTVQQYFTLTLSGLTAPSYDIEIIATSNDGHTNQNLTVDGEFASSTPNGEGFSARDDGRGDGNVLAWVNLVPTNGELVIKVEESASNKTANISAMGITAIPEPATMGLIVLGASGLALRRRRRK